MKIFFVFLFTVLLAGCIHPPDTQPEPCGYVQLYGADWVMVENTVVICPNWQNGNYIYTTGAWFCR